MKNRRGFTLIELLIVVSIIGVVASITIPNLLSASQKARQRATMADMKSIGTAIESYMTDFFQAPADLTFGNASLKAFYIKKSPATDGWGNTWEYQSDKEIYYIGSAARDGVFLGFDQEGSYRINTEADLNKDLIFSNGSFMFGPGQVAESSSSEEEEEDGSPEDDDSNDDDDEKEDDSKKDKKKKKKKKNKKPRGRG